MRIFLKTRIFPTARTFLTTRIFLTAATLMLLGATSSPFAAEAEVSILRVASATELQQTFCAADPTVEHILVLPASLFVDSEELVCPVGPYKLYRIIEHDDPDDFEYYLDPPFGTAGRLGCDGKAGRSMTIIAVNCRPI